MKKPPIWQLPAIIVASVGALGTAAVVTARYVNLPAQVEAGEQKNVQQDKQIDRLITLQEYYQQQQQAPNQPRPRQVGLREWDEQEQTAWCCSEDDREVCWEQQLWRKCE